MAVSTVNSSLNAKGIQSHNCCPSCAAKALHLASWPDRPCTVQNQNYFKRAIVNIRKRKSSRTHVLCDDLVLFHLRSRNLSPVCTGTAILFVKCNRSENQFKENLNKSNRTKEAKTEGQNDLASFCAQRSQKRGQSPCKNLERRPICCLNKKCWFLAPANKIRMHSLVPQERKYH